MCPLDVLFPDQGSGALKLELPLKFREIFAIFRGSPYFFLVEGSLSLYHTRLSIHRNIVGPFSKIRELSSTALTETLKLLTNCYLLQQ